MAIYKGDKQINLYKGNYNLVDFYKGDSKILGYDFTKISGSNALTLSDVSTLKHAIKCKLQTKNKFDESSWYRVSSAVWTVENGVFTATNDYWSGFTMLVKGGVKKGVTYTLSANILTPNSSMWFRVQSGDLIQSANTPNLSPNMVVNTAGKHSVTFTADADYDTVRLNCVGIAADNGVFSFTEPQLEEGSTATDYAPYISDFSTHTITTVGKNLFNKENLPHGTTNETTYYCLLDDGRIWVPKNPGYGRVTLKTVAPELKVGKTYVMNYETTATSKYIYLGGSKTIWKCGQPHTITQEDLDNIFSMYTHPEIYSTSAYITNFQIEEGTTPTAYEPYTKHVEPLKVTVSGKNALNWGTAEFTTLGYRQFDPPIPAGTYRFSALVSSEDVEADRCRYIIFTNDGGQVGGYLRRGNTRTSDYFTAKAPIYQINLNSSDGSEASRGDAAVFKDMMLELGMTATDYEPYVEPVSYTPEADGSVKDLLSATKTMILSSNSGDVTFDVAYLKN